MITCCRYKNDPYSLNCVVKLWKKNVRELSKVPKKRVLSKTKNSCCEIPLKPKHNSFLGSKCPHNNFCNTVGIHPDFALSWTDDVKSDYKGQKLKSQVFLVTWLNNYYNNIYRSRKYFENFFRVFLISKMRFYSE